VINKNVEAQNLVMILISMSVIFFTFVAIGYSKIILIFPVGTINDMTLFNLASAVLLIIIIPALNNAFLSRKIVSICFWESIISLILSFIALTTASLFIDIIRMTKIFNDFISNNLTLCVLLLTICLQVGLTYLVFVYLVRYPYYSILWITDNTKLLEYQAFATKELIKKIHSTTQIEKYYSILVIIATVMWLNNDEVEPGNAFGNLYDTSVWILIFSLSVYSTYIVMFLLKINTSSLRDIK